MWLHRRTWLSSSFYRQARLPSSSGPFLPVHVPPANTCAQPSQTRWGSELQLLLPCWAEHGQGSAPREAAQPGGPPSQDPEGTQLDPSQTSCKHPQPPPSAKPAGEERVTQLLGPGAEGGSPAQGPHPPLSEVSPGQQLTPPGPWPQPLCHPGEDPNSPPKRGLPSPRAQGWGQGSQRADSHSVATSHSWVSAT